MTNLRKILEELTLNTMGNPPFRINFAYQQILALIPEKEGCKEGEQYWMWKSLHNVYAYGKMIGKNQAISEMTHNLTKEE